MRRVLAASALAALLLTAGCSGGNASKAPEPASAPVVLGTSAAMSGSQGPSAPPAPAASSIAAIPDKLFGGNAAAKGIVEATSAPKVSRAEAIQRSNPGTGTLVSAVCVIVPASAMRGIVSDKQQAMPTTAWIVTWTGVPWARHGVFGASTQTASPQRQVGDSTAVIDATTGELLRFVEGSTPN